MANERTIEAQVRQQGASTGKATVRSHSLLVDRPTEKGGADQGPMGGELLLLALGGCFLSNLLAAARTRDADVDDVTVTIEARLGESPERMTHFTLQVSGKYEDRAEMEKLVTIAERGCLVAATLRAGAVVEVLLT
ncbi:MAG: OsmC family protein [Gemmatimonadota bacterium]